MSAKLPAAYLARIVHDAHVVAAKAKASDLINSRVRIGWSHTLGLYAEASCFTVAVRSSWHPDDMGDETQWRGGHEPWTVDVDRATAKQLVSCFKTSGRHMQAPVTVHDPEGLTLRMTSETTDGNPYVTYMADCLEPVTFDLEVDSIMDAAGDPVDRPKVLVPGTVSEILGKTSAGGVHAAWYPVRTGDYLQRYAMIARTGLREPKESDMAPVGDRFVLVTSPRIAI